MRRATRPPAFCSSCFQAKPQMLHIDFEAAYDGPVINDGGIKVMIDDLVICEDCLSVAAKMVGMVHDEELKAENKELGEAVEGLATENEELTKLVKDLQSSNQRLSSTNLRKVPGRPKRSIQAGAV